MFIKGSVIYEPCWINAVGIILSRISEFRDYSDYYKTNECNADCLIHPNVKIQL